MSVDQQQITQTLSKCKKGARTLRATSIALRNAVLMSASELLWAHRETLFKANEKDLALLSKEASPAFRDRLLLDEKRLFQATKGIEYVAGLKDPIGEEVSNSTLPNGLILKKVRSPLGVILLVFESRPNVAIEAFSLAFKSGNILILRGGKESVNTTAEIYTILSEALKVNGMDDHLFWGISDPNRELVSTLLSARNYIDIVVPRGGEGLINYVVQNSEIPIIKNDRGMCHIFVDKHASLDKAVSIVTNAKTQRPGVCNSLETVLVDNSIATEFLPKAFQSMEASKVKWFCCPSSLKILAPNENIHPINAESFDTEYLDLKINCRVVDDLDSAITHIDQHSSKHSESIVTENKENARQFQNEIDSAAVYWNASTRFTDGFEFGLGGELGISTQKLHVRGPVGLNELTSIRWVIDGNGQIRD